MQEFSGLFKIRCLLKSAGVGSATFRERSIQKGVPSALGQNTGMMDKETSTQANCSFQTKTNRDSAKIKH